tara:strand:- start:2350 stop:2889 length:540 start_codon:yes stop_codon:yes gene_type:complete
MIPLQVAKGLSRILPPKKEEVFCPQYMFVMVSTTEGENTLYAEATDGFMIAQVTWGDHSCVELEGEFYISAEDLREWIRTKGATDLPFTEEPPEEYVDITTATGSMVGKRRRGKTFCLQVPFLKKVLSFAGSMGLKKGMHFSSTKSNEPIVITFQPEDKSVLEEVAIVLAPYSWNPKER